MTDWPYPIEFFVPGDPAPQGSKTLLGSGQMRESSRRLQPWREVVAQMAMLSRHNHTFECPLYVTYHFYLLRDGDLDKLVRGVNDGLQNGNLIDDDNLIVWILAAKYRKREWQGLPGIEAGCRIKLEPL